MGQKTLAKTPPKSPGENGFKYRDKYGVIVTCADEAEQERIYLGLRALGFKCRVVVV